MMTSKPENIQDRITSFPFLPTQQSFHFSPPITTPMPVEQLIAFHEQKRISNFMDILSPRKMPYVSDYINSIAQNMIEKQISSNVPVPLNPQTTSEWNQDEPENLSTKSSQPDEKESSNPELAEEEVLNHLKGKDLTVSRIVSCKSTETKVPQQSLQVVNVNMSQYGKEVPITGPPASRGESSENEVDSKEELVDSDSLSTTNSVSSSLPSYIFPDVTSPSPSISTEPVEITNVLSASVLLRQLTSHNRRPRGQKKPIPDHQKTPRYYERRQRNNRAAKKSRDQRKMREEMISKRVIQLQAENSILRARVASLDDETARLRLVLAQRQQNNNTNITS